MLKYVLLILGFVLLIKGADFFVDGSSSVAKRLKVPPLIIGMTIVAMGTSLPECSVSVTASLANANAMAISNAIGSNIFNLMVVCGVCALFCPLKIEKGTLLKEFPFSVGVAALLAILGVTGMVVGHIEGVVMLVIFAVFLFWMVQSARKSRTNAAEETDAYKILPIWKCIVFIVLGGVAIAYGGDLVVDSASKIATSFGMSDTLVGLTIVAFGTSLPELVTSVVAARKNNVDMALGNVIGSNIFNIIFVLGIAASISPVAFMMENIIDIIVLIAMSVMVWLFCWKKKQLVRWQGAVMLACYVAYILYVCNR